MYKQLLGDSKFFSFVNWNIFRFICYIYIHDNTHFLSSLNAVLWKIHALTHADRLYL